MRRRRADRSAVSAVRALPLSGPEMRGG